MSNQSPPFSSRTFLHPNAEQIADGTVDALHPCVDVGTEGHLTSIFLDHDALQALHELTERLLGRLA